MVEKADVEGGGGRDRDGLRGVLAHLPGLTSPSKAPRGKTSALLGG